MLRKLCDKWWSPPCQQNNLFLIPCAMSEIINCYEWISVFLLHSNAFSTSAATQMDNFILKPRENIFCRASRMNAHRHDWCYFTACTIESQIKATLGSRLDLDFLCKIELFSSLMLTIESNTLTFVDRIQFHLGKTLCNWSPVIWRW